MTRPGKEVRQAQMGQEIGRRVDRGLCRGENRQPSGPKVRERKGLIRIRLWHNLASEQGGSQTHQNWRVVHVDILLLFIYNAAYSVGFFLSG